MFILCLHREKEPVKERRSHSCRHIQVETWDLGMRKHLLMWLSCMWGMWHTGLIKEDFTMINTAQHTVCVFYILRCELWQDTDSPRSPKRESSVGHVHGDSLRHTECLQVSETPHLLNLTQPHRPVWSKTARLWSITLQFIHSSGKRWLPDVASTLLQQLSPMSHTWKPVLRRPIRMICMGRRRLLFKRVVSVKWWK